MLHFVLVAVLMLVGTSFGVAVSFRSDREALRLGTLGTSLSCLLGLVASVRALVTAERSSFRVPWSLPVGEFHLGLDGLSSFFLVCVFLVSGLAAIYGERYLLAHAGKRRLAPAAAFFSLLVAAMALVVVARDGIVFLITWEAMSFASFFLVTFEDDREEVRRAGMIYLVASQLGVVFVFILFALLARGTGHYDFEVFAQNATANTGLGIGFSSLCFVLAVVGFGAKAGFWPLHIWLPDAHPAAPSHVSAVMSGAMIKLGVYGLLRTLSFLGPPRAWWAVLLIAIGAVTGLTGILNALAQRDIKRRLAYSSVENIGIIALGMGIGLLGQSQENLVVAFLGYAGCLLHVLNHGLIKGLLFQAAGSVFHATGTRDIESLGSLYRRMPTTGAAFLVGALGISGLPPLNAFAGELLIYLGAFQGASSLRTIWGLSALSVVPILALLSGLAAVCFVKTFSGVFLGEARTNAAETAHEASPGMTWPMIAGASLALAFGLWPLGVVVLIAPATLSLTQTSAVPPRVFEPLFALGGIATVLFALVGLLALLRLRLLRHRQVTRAVTWGCGYASPNPRMRYSALSFAEPVTTPFSGLIQSSIRREGPTGYFPDRAHFEENVSDMAGDRLLIPAGRRLLGAMARLRILQQGRVQHYLVYIAVTLVVLLLWQLAGWQPGSKGN